VAQQDRSAEACPECGAHRLATVPFPTIDTVGYQPYSELIGMGQPSIASSPAIGCLHCGAAWPDLEAFRAGKPGVKIGDRSANSNGGAEEAKSHDS